MKAKIATLTISALMMITLISVFQAGAASANGNILNVPSEYLTIQAAIDAAEPGDTIEVAAGEYAGAIVNENVTISGAADGTSIITSGVPYKAAGGPGTAFRLDENADGTEIRNFTINCDESAVFFFAVFSRGADNVIIDSLIVNNTVQGITNYGGSDWEITNNILTDTHPTTGGGIAIYLGAYPPDYPVCSGNLIENNKMTTAYPGAATFTCPGISMAFDMREKTLDDLTDDEDMSNNQILNNTITVIGDNSNNTGGIEIGVFGLEDNAAEIAACLGIIHNNIVQGNTVNGADKGIYFYTVTNLTIQQNEIENCNEGIYIKDDHSGVAINYNNIVGNTIGINNASASTIDATLNWWGRPDIVGIIKGTEGNINADPWLDAPYPDGNSVTSKGETGDKGDLGNDGADGEDGADGAPGLTGATGATGSTGEKGDTGDVGPQGTTGSQGSQGETGATGSKGSVGEDTQAGIAWAALLAAIIALLVAAYAVTKPEKPKKTAKKTQED